MEAFSSRREFLLSASAALGAGWLTAHLPEIEALSVTAQHAFETGQEFKNLTAAEARTVAAFAERIVPSDALPGAGEAGAIYFIDGALGGFAQGMKELVQNGAKALDDGARRENRQVSSFAELTTAQQIRVMKRAENQGFFGVLRILTVMGVFADPKYGGNRDLVGFRILDVQHAPAYTPPFGYYDAQELQKARQP
jgi:gluconate 2-dehydrogenase gamma chain